MFLRNLFRQVFIKNPTFNEDDFHEHVKIFYNLLNIETSILELKIDGNISFVDSYETEKCLWVYNFHITTYEEDDEKKIFIDLMKKFKKFNSNKNEYFFIQIGLYNFKSYGHAQCLVYEKSSKTWTFFNSGDNVMDTELLKYLSKQIGFVNYETISFGFQENYNSCN